MTSAKARKGATSRHRGREIALQTLYAIDLGARQSSDEDASGGSKPAPPSPHEAFEAVSAHFEAPPGARDFAWELIEKVSLHGKELDERIAAHARNWRISRMAAVDRNILRLGVCELAYTETPAAVVLDEAVELARRFSSEPSPAFVNGILDALAHELREGEL